MDNNNTSPSLDDLLGGMGDINTSPSSTAAQKSSPPQTLSDTPPAVSSLDDLLASSDITPEPIEEKKTTGRISRKNNTPEESPAMSLEDLLGDTEEKHTAAISIQDAHSKEEGMDLNGNQGKDSKNIFHKDFKENAVDKDGLLQNIEDYQDKGLTLEGAGEERTEDPFILLKEKEEEVFQEKNKKFRKFLVLAQSSIVFGTLSLLISFGVFSYLLDTPTKGMLGNFVEKNYGIELEEKIAKIASIEDEHRALKKDIAQSEKIINGFKNNSVLETIIHDRINWIQIIDEINQVRCESNPLSDISECKEDLRQGRAIINPFTFENYTTKGGMKNGQIEVVIAGKASGSQGYIFQKISRLIETFNDSKYFSGATMRQFAKTEDSRVGFYMPFTMKLIYHKEGKIPSAETSNATQTDNSGGINADNKMTQDLRKKILSQ